MPAKVGRGGEDVRPEPRDRACVQLEHRPVPLARLDAGAAQDEPRSATQAGRPRGHDGPAPVHPQMAVQDDAALEAEQQVLPDRLDGRADACRRAARPAGSPRRAGSGSRPRRARRRAAGACGPRGEVRHLPASRNQNRRRGSTRSSGRSGGGRRVGLGRAARHGGSPLRLLRHRSAREGRHAGRALANGRVPDPRRERRDLRSRVGGVEPAARRRRRSPSRSPSTPRSGRSAASSTGTTRRAAPRA